MSRNITCRPAELLFVATLYPNAAMPAFAPFVEHRIRRLCADGGVRGIVLSPVPRHLLPLPAALDRYARWRAVPQREERYGLEIRHPRYPMLPGLGMYAQPLAVFHALAVEWRRLAAAGRSVDLIDAHYAYPDGVAAALLAQKLGRPFFVTGRGTDLNRIPDDPLARAWLRWSLPKAAACIAVSDDLARKFRELGVDPARIHTIRNGVDFTIFRPQPRAAARHELGLKGPVLLAVGELSERKGMAFLIEMLPLVPDATLVLIGDGADRERLLRRAQALGVADRLRLTGVLPQERLPLWYSAADLLLLASQREGTPNVVLEAMACGTRVVATAVGGVPEVLPPPPLGFLVPVRDPALFARTVGEALATPADPAALLAHSAQFDWAHTTARLRALIDQVLGRR